MRLYDCKSRTVAFRKCKNLVEEVTACKHHPTFLLLDPKLQQLISNHKVKSEGRTASNT